MNTKLQGPPPVIHSARTLWYAVNDGSVEASKQKVEKDYKGISSNWVHAEASEDDVNKYAIYLQLATDAWLVLFGVLLLAASFNKGPFKPPL